MNRAVYSKGKYFDLEVQWDNSGYLLDLTGHVIQLDCFAFGGPVLFTKTTGFTIPPLVDSVVQSPNLVVSWSTTPGDELDGLEPGSYVLKFTDDHNNEQYGELIFRVNAPNFGYCEISDLLLGDMTLSPDINHYDYINGTADEMNGMLGQRYVLPLALDSAPAWVTLKLKTINSKLATGRLIQSLAIAHEDNSVHDYGQKLIDGAITDLNSILNGGTALPGLTIEPTSFQANAPSITNHDTYSAVDAFEQAFMRPQFPPRISKTVWRPGAPVSVPPLETESTL